MPRVQLCLSQPRKLAFQNRTLSAQNYTVLFSHLYSALFSDYQLSSNSFWVINCTWVNRHRFVVIVDKTIIFWEKSQFLIHLSLDLLHTIQLHLLSGTSFVFFNRLLSKLNKDIKIIYQNPACHEDSFLIIQ